MTDTAVAIAIEGIGLEGSPSSPEPYLFATDALAEYDTSSLSFTVWPYLNLDGLGSISTSTDIFRAKTTWGAFDFGLEAFPDKVAELLFYEQKRADAVLQEDVAPSDFTLKLDDSGLADTVIYVGEETMALGSATGTSGGVTTYNIATRAAYQSEAQAHTQDANVFTSVPYWGSRRVWLYDLERDPTKSQGFEFHQRWIGRITGSFRQDLGRITVPTREVMSGLNNVKRGRASRSFERMGVAYYYRDLNQGPSNARPPGPVVAAMPYDGSYTPKIRKPDTFNTVAFQVDDEIVLGSADVDATPEYEGTASFNNTPIFGKNYPTERFGEGKDAKSLEDRKIEPEDVYEVFVADRIYSGATSLTAGNTQDDLWGYRWHPLAYYGAFHLSEPGTPIAPDSFDVFQADWTLDLKHLFVDDIVDRLWKLMRETADQEIDRIILGENGQTVSLRQFSREALLRPYGWTEGITNDGLLTVEPLRDADVEFYDTALNNKIRPEPSDLLDLSNGRSQTVDAVEVILGSEFLEDRRSIIVQARDDSSTRAADQAASPDLAYDLSTIDPERGGWARDQVVGKLLQQHFAMPRLRVRVPDHTFQSRDYGIGTEVALEDLDVEPRWLVDKNGDRVTTIGDDVQWAGYIVGRQYLPTERAYELELLLSGSSIIRWRAPSGVIESVSGTGTASQSITLGGDSTDSAFGDEDTDNTTVGNVLPDAQRFTEGDEVRVWKPDGTLWNSEIREIASISSDTVTLDGSFSSAPPAGHILELAYLQTSSGSGYENDGLGSTFDFVDRAYFYLADQDDTLGTTNIAADEYGA